MSPAQASSHHDPDRDPAGRCVSFATRLPPERASAAAARRLVRTRLGPLVGAPTLDDVVLVVSELVTKAVRHGRGDVDLRLDFDGRRVKGDVSDEGESCAQRTPRAPADVVGGNGLRVVEEIASSWGVQADSAQTWFEIAAPPARLH